MLIRSPGHFGPGLQAQAVEQLRFIWRQRQGQFLPLIGIAVFVHMGARRQLPHGHALQRRGQLFQGAGRRHTFTLQAVHLVYQGRTITTGHRL